MKAITYVAKIEKENACSIHTAEKLTEALIRENILDSRLCVRFRPLFGDFQIIEKKWFENQDQDIFATNTFNEPNKIIIEAREATERYRKVMGAEG